MKFLLFPPELILTIAETLPPKDVNSLLQTSHYLTSLLTPLLHKLALEDKNGMNALSWASLNGHEPLVRLILSNSAHDINDARSGWTALHRAVQREHEGIVRVLLENGADPNMKDKRAQTPLLWCPDGMTDVARLLLDYGADVGSRNRVYVTRLHKAVWKRDVAMVRLLLERGARFPTSGVREGMRFNNGTVEKDPGLIEAFLEFGGRRDVWCRRCLVRWADAIGWGEIARVKYRLHEDGDGSEMGSPRDRDGDVEPKQAFITKSPVKKLQNRFQLPNLNHDLSLAPLTITAIPHITTLRFPSRPLTPIHARSSKPSNSIHLQDKTDSDKTSAPDGATELSSNSGIGMQPGHVTHGTAHQKRREMIILQSLKGYLQSITPLKAPLHLHHGPPSPPPLIHSSPASKLSTNPPPSLLSFPNELLLVIASDLDLKDLNSLLQTSRRLASLLTPNLHRLAVQDRDAGWWIPFPALHWAAWKGYEGLAKLLLDKGFDSNLRTTFQGKTALHFAALKGHTSIIRLLLDRGAKVDMQDISYGMSPLHIAALEGHEGVVRLLLDRGANVSIGDHTGRTALVWTARYASLDKDVVGVFRLLLERGADVDVRERECGGTSLHWAVEKGRRETVRLLLEKGASLTVLSDSKETAVDWALRKNDDEMVRLLLGSEGMDDQEGSSSAMCRGVLARKLRSLSIASREL